MTDSRSCGQALLLSLFFLLTFQDQVEIATSRPDYLRGLPSPRHLSQYLAPYPCLLLSLQTFWLTEGQGIGDLHRQGFEARHRINRLSRRR